jgi:hypothetical protein
MAWQIAVYVWELFAKYEMVVAKTRRRAILRVLKMGLQLCSDYKLSSKPFHADVNRVNRNAKL